MKRQIECPVCQKLFEVNVNTHNQQVKNGWKMYCTPECRKIGRQTSSILVKCAKCDKEVRKPNAQLKRSLSGRMFCSKSCSTAYNNQFKIGEKHPAFTDAGYRKKALRLKENICEGCGNSDIRVLQVHHIDGNRKNNELDNLAILCANCHCIRHYEESKNIVVA